MYDNLWTYEKAFNFSDFFIPLLHRMSEWLQQKQSNRNRFRSGEKIESIFTYGR